MKLHNGGHSSGDGRGNEFHESSQGKMHPRESEALPGICDVVRQGLTTPDLYRGRNLMIIPTTLSYTYMIKTQYRASTHKHYMGVCEIRLVTKNKPSFPCLSLSPRTCSSKSSNIAQSLSTSSNIRLPHPLITYNHRTSLSPTWVFPERVASQPNSFIFLSRFTVSSPRISSPANHLPLPPGVTSRTMDRWATAPMPSSRSRTVRLAGT